LAHVDAGEHRVHVRIGAGPGVLDQLLPAGLSAAVARWWKQLFTHRTTVSPMPGSWLREHEKSSAKWGRS
jgi:hypothetical protein